MPDDTNYDPEISADAFDDDGENTPIEDPDDDTEVFDTPEEDAAEDPDGDAPDPEAFG